MFEVDCDTAGPDGQGPVVQQQLDGARRPPGPQAASGGWTGTAGSMRSSCTPRCRPSWRPTGSYRVPTVISVDATPRQYDELGEHYDHRREGRVRRGERSGGPTAPASGAPRTSWPGRRGRSRAWSTSTTSTPTKVTVIPRASCGRSGPRRSRASEHEGPVRILFVGGAWQRKGGDLLLGAFHDLRSQTGAGRHAPSGRAAPRDQHALEDAPGVVVHRGLAPNNASPRRALPNRRHLLPAHPGRLPRHRAVRSRRGRPPARLDRHRRAARDRARRRDGPRRAARRPARARPRHCAGSSSHRSFAVASAAARERTRRAGPRRGEEHPAAGRARSRPPASEHARRRVSLVRRRRASGIGLRNRTLLTVSGDRSARSRAPGGRGFAARTGLRRAGRGDVRRPAGRRRGPDGVRAVRARCSSASAAPALLLAWACFRSRRRYDTIVTDGEQVGLAARAAPAADAPIGRRAHVMIVHILSAPKKVLLYRAAPPAPADRHDDRLLVVAAALHPRPPAASRPTGSC